MIIKYEFFVELTDFNQQPIPSSEINYQTQVYMDKGVVEMGKMITEKIGYEKINWHGKDWRYKIEAVVFGTDQWRKFVRDLRAGLHNIAAPGIVDDLIKQLENK